MKRAYPPPWWHIHWHRLHHRTQAYDYVECRCGSRAGIYRLGSGYSPMDWNWVAEKMIHSLRPSWLAPPKEGSGSVRG